LTVYLAQLDLTAFKVLVLSFALQERTVHPELKKPPNIHANKVITALQPDSKTPLSVCTAA
jgi:hypothetical protein